MSDYESSNAESDGESNPVTVEMFQCRKCPGKLFTAAEKDLHRKMHKDQKKKRTTRAPSPAQSEATLFTPANEDTPVRGAGTSASAAAGRRSSPPAPPQNQGGTKRGRTDDGKSPGPASRKKKIKSTKSTNQPPIMFNTTTGG